MLTRQNNRKRHPTTWTPPSEKEIPQPKPDSKRDNIYIFSPSNIIDIRPDTSSAPCTNCYHQKSICQNTNNHLLLFYAFQRTSIFTSCEFISEKKCYSQLRQVQQTPLQSSLFPYSIFLPLKINTYFHSGEGIIRLCRIFAYNQITFKKRLSQAHTYQS
jgi:hypothetical protein